MLSLVQEVCQSIWEDLVLPTVFLVRKDWICLLILLSFIFVSEKRLLVVAILFIRVVMLMLADAALYKEYGSELTIILMGLLVTAISVGIDWSILGWLYQRGVMWGEYLAGKIFVRV